MRAPAATGTAGRYATRRIWLPRALYEAMPWIYCGLGAASLLSGLFLPHPGWLAPYLLLLAVTGIHAGIGFLMLRRRHRLGRLSRERENRESAARPFPGGAAM